MFDIKYNGLCGKDHSVLVRERPNIPATVKKYEKITVLGRDGDLYAYDGTVEDIIIPVIFTFKSMPDKWHEIYRNLRRWLLTSESGELSMSDDKNYYYKVKNIKFSGTERTAKVVGEIEVNFTCDGYQYLREGKFFVNLPNTFYNAMETSHPVFYIEGEGVCELVVNGNVMSANISQNITIDTDLMIAYRDDGILRNTAVTGDYEKLYFLPGYNIISITDGFTLKVQPNWRCI